MFLGWGFRENGKKGLPPIKMNSFYVVMYVDLTGKIRKLLVQSEAPKIMVRKEFCVGVKKSFTFMHPPP